MKNLYSIFLVSILSVSAVAARRKTAAPYITSSEVRHCEILYVVQLQEGYSIEDHFETIDLDLSQNTTTFYPMIALNSYRARLDSYIIHRLVRYDPGVVSVLHDYYDDGEPRAFDGEAVEDAFEDKNEEEPSLLRRWSPQTI